MCQKYLGFSKASSMIYLAVTGNLVSFMWPSLLWPEKGWADFSCSPISVYMFKNPAIHLIVIEQLLYAAYPMRCWNTAMSKTGKNPCTRKAYIQCGRSTVKTINTTARVHDFISCASYLHKPSGENNSPFIILGDSKGQGTLELACFCSMTFGPQLGGIRCGDRSPGARESTSEMGWVEAEGLWAGVPTCGLSGMVT